EERSGIPSKVESLAGRLDPRAATGPSRARPRVNRIRIDRLHSAGRANPRSEMSRITESQEAASRKLIVVQSRLLEVAPSRLPAHSDRSRSAGLESPT